MTNLKFYTIFGERNCGTNYLKKILNKLIHLQFTQKFGYKHWYIKDVFPRGPKNNTTDNECVESIKNSDDTLFIVIVRNPYDWSGSMYKKPYYIKNGKKPDLFSFVTNEISTSGVASQKYQLWKSGDYFIEKDKHLVELRNKKNNHFYHLSKFVKNYYLIRQEYLFNDIWLMIKKFSLDYNISDVPLYIKPTNYTIDEKTKQFIKENLNNLIDKQYYLD